MLAVENSFPLDRTIAGYIGVFGRIAKRIPPFKFTG